MRGFFDSEMVVLLFSGVKQTKSRSWRRRFVSEASSTGRRESSWTPPAISALRPSLRTASVTSATTAMYGAVLDAEARSPCAPTRYNQRSQFYMYLIRSKLYHAHTQLQPGKYENFQSRIPRMPFKSKCFNHRKCF